MAGFRSKATCSSACLFLCPFFTNNFDHVGMSEGSQKNFSTSFLATRNDLLIRHAPTGSQPSPTEIEKSRIAVHIYTKLRDKQIRLLKLSPGKFSELLECDLIEYDIESASEKYDALSYTWGRPNFPARIYCRGIAMPITQNLSDALHFLRDEKKPRMLWIDALCINQSDLDEKTKQIPLMYKIYANAEHTAVWLGSANERDLVMIEQLQAILIASEDQLSGRHTSKCIDVIIQMHDWAYRFLSRAWFTRSWIRQEVAASKRCSIVCGDAVIHFDDFEVGMTRFLQLDVQLPRHTASMPVQSDTAAVRFYRLIKQKKELATLVTRARTALHTQCFSNDEKYLPLYVCREWFKLVLHGAIFAATDPKDKIYSMAFALQNALMPITTASKNVYSDFRMDYKLSMSCAYQNFLKALINTSRTLDPLSFFRPNFSFDPQSTLPAWTPDLRKPVSGCLTISSPENVGTAELQEISDGFRPLRLRGTILGHIGQDLSFADVVKDVDRVRLDDLEELGFYASESMEARSLNPLWQAGEPSDTILTGAGYGIFELVPTAQASQSLGLDTSMTIVFASRDAETGDLVICAYGSFHPFVLRANPMFQLPDGTKMERFFGPAIVWKQHTQSAGVDSNAHIQHILQEPTVTDEVAINFGWRRWRPSARVMNDQLLGSEQKFHLF